MELAYYLTVVLQARSQPQPREGAGEFGNGVQGPTEGPIGGVKGENPQKPELFCTSRTCICHIYIYIYFLQFEMKNH